MGDNRYAYNFWYEKLKEIDVMEYLSVDGR
jgi:hypothetical protein